MDVQGLQAEGREARDYVQQLGADGGPVVVIELGGKDAVVFFLVGVIFLRLVAFQNPLYGTAVAQLIILAFPILDFSKCA